MREILDYQIITAYSTYDLQSAVKEQLRNGEGWQPFNSLSALAGSGDTVDFFSQPMVIYGRRMED